MKGFAGVLAGLVVAIAVAVLVSFLGGFVVGAPEAVDISTRETIRETYSSLGAGTQLLGIIAWALGAFAGAYLAKRISGRAWAAWTVAGIVTVYQLLSVVMLPMPAYMQVLALLLPVLGGFLANRLVPSVAAAEGVPAEASADAEV